VSVFSADYCSRAMPDYVWLVGQCMFLLRLVVVQLCWNRVEGNMSSGLCVTLSPGERVRKGSDNSWKGSCNCHRAWRFPIWSVAEAQGKGGLEAKGLFR
jgi:hypothetical protein